MKGVTYSEPNYYCDNIVRIAVVIATMDNTYEKLADKPVTHGKAKGNGHETTRISGVPWKIFEPSPLISFNLRQCG